MKQFKKVDGKVPLSKAFKIHGNIMNNVQEDTDVDSCIAAVNAFDEAVVECSKRKEDVVGFIETTYEQIAFELADDGSGNYVNPSTGTVVSQVAPPKYVFHSKLFMRFVRDAISFTVNQDSITITFKPGYEWLMAFVTPDLRINHDAIGFGYSQNKLPSDMGKFISDIPTQVAAFGTSYVPKNTNK